MNFLTTKTLMLVALLLGSIATVRAVDGGSVTSNLGDTLAACTNDGIPDLLTMSNTSSSSDPYAYVLTTPATEVLAISVDGNFDLENFSDGENWIWGLSFTGNVLVGIGDTVLTFGALTDSTFDLSDNYVVVYKSSPDAGTLTADASSVCTSGSATISATPNGNANVPAGYSTVYVLTEGAGLVIQNAGASPSFTVTSGGNYTIHTLVYDPNTLDLSIVVPGVTTGFDVNSLLVQGGGSICASLDVAGAPISVANPNAGTLTADASSVCLSGSAIISATPNGDANVPAGYSTVYVLTEGAGLVIQNAGASPSFTVTSEGNYTIHTLVYDPNTLDLSIVVPGVTTGFDVNSLLVQGGGSICASLDVAGAPISVANPNAGTLTADASSVCLSGNTTISATPNGDANVPAGYSTVYVLTEGAGLVIQNAGASPSFTVTSEGNYTIHTLVYDPNTLDLSIVVPGVTTGFDVNSLLVQGGGSICASLDVAGAPISVANPNAGTLTADASSVCASGSATISATPNGDANVPAGYSTVYVLTEGAGLVIQNAGASPSFTVTSEGNYTIHTLVYDPNTLDLSIVVPGVTTGFDVNSLLVQGGGSICASLDVAGAPISVANPNAGTLTADASSVCLNGSATISATPNGDANVPAGYSTVYVLTEGAGLVIQNAGASPSFTVTSEGNYTIHTLVYDPNTLDLSIVVPGVTTGFDVNSLLVQGGGSICASLDVAGAPISVANPNAGTLTADASSACLDNGSATISATPNGDANVPAGYSTVYVLTEGAGLVIQNAGASPSFTVTSEGNYTIHTLVYDPNTLDLSIVVPGVTTGFDVNSLLVQGGGSICASLDVAGAPIAVANPNAGTLTADASSVCTSGSAIISATPNGDANVPAGYSTVYVLTEGAGLVIQNAGASPSFTVTSEGNYTIHTLVYDPNTLDLSIVVPGVTTGFDVNSLLVQGGGSICASLDVAGAPISVANPNAGTLTADASSACLDNGSATISATPNGDANVPAGYSTVYVLTEGAGLVIQNAGASPSFTVTSAGNYTIHILVYDPNTLDLSIVVPGVTTGFDVNSLLVQGGGNICASLDVAGAPISVANPNAGTLTADASSVCLNGSAAISATPNGDANVPAGYSTVYVLTEGAGLVIQNAGASPSFTVTSEGNYTIHTLVYDPNTLDLSIVVPGVTTGFDVNSLLVQGGGSICASLDVAGAPISVANPNAGTLTADASSVCLSGNTTISATPNGDANVPAGYSTVYVLTEGAGLVIQNAGASPSFTVTSEGNYTIHTLVYDPNTLDLSIVVPGVTTGFDVNSLLVQGGGSICASLDVAGAPISVANPNAGTLTADASSVCLSGSATISATPNGDANVPAGYSTVYVLTEGAGLVIQNAGASPSFTVTSEGNYTIHTLVYDPNTLDLSIVVPGVTTGFDVNSLLVQGGGSICASLDVAGAPISVANPNAGTLTADASSVCLSGSATISATPNGDANVPAGYSTVYVLTEGAGLVIQNAGASPSFTVTSEGNYTIHTLVYDPNTLDLSIVVPGVTTGFDVNSLLVQGGGSICASLDVAGAPITVSSAGISGFTLVNSFTDLDISALNDGDTINLFYTPNVNIRAEICGTTGSIRFSVNGSPFSIENIAPYAIAGDAPNGNYKNWSITPGTYTITATPYSRGGAFGTAGTPFTVTITVIDQQLPCNGPGCCSIDTDCDDGDNCTTDFCNAGNCINTPAGIREISGFTLVDAATDTDIAPLGNGSVIDLDATPNVNVRANLCANSGTGSVKFKVNGLSFRTENIAPFALAGDNPTGDYRQWHIKPGTYTIEAKAYAGANGSGTSGTGQFITITVIGGSFKNSGEENALDTYEPLPASAQLSAFPNPFSDAVTIRFTPATEQRVRLDIATIEGKTIATLFDGIASGSEQYNISYSASGLSDGIYLYRLIAEDGTVTNGKLMLMRP